jgi:hypothetical protein
MMDLQGIAKYAVRIDQLPIDLETQVDKEAGVYLSRTVDDSPNLNPFDSSDPSKLATWVKLHTEPFTELDSAAALQHLLLTRNKTHFLDSIVVAYAPEGSEQERQLEEVIEKVKYHDFITQVMLASASTHIRFYRIKDPEVAAALKLDTEGGLKLYKYKDSRGWFDARLPKTAYVSAERLKAYLADHLGKDYKINGNLMQLDLGLYRDEFAYAPNGSPSVEGRTHSYPTLQALAAGLSRVDPLICPLWSVKDLQLVSMKVASFLRNHSKVLIVSLNKDRDEKDLSDLGILFRQLKIEQVAKDNPDLLVVVGQPQYIYHLPLHDIAYFHNSDVEVRLLDVQAGRVVSTATFNGEGDLTQWVKAPTPELQSAPDYPVENARHIDAEGLKQVLGDDQCYFVMYCSDTCPACNYTAPHFQAAAALPSPCKYLKFNISNDCATSKPPGATPTFLLYRPGHKQEPVKFDVRERGLGADKFAAFVEELVSTN